MNDPHESPIAKGKAISISIKPEPQEYKMERSREFIKVFSATQCNQINNIVQTQPRKDLLRFTLQNKLKLK